MTFQIIILVLSVLLLLRSASWLVQGITTMAQYLQWKEFVIAFFVMAIGGSIPNLFIGISSALRGIPELSLGDVMGNSVVDLTLVAGIAAIIGSGLIAEGKLVQTSAFLTISVAILPLLLILDGSLGRGDGIALITIFIIYSIWLFSKRKTFAQTLDTNEKPPLKKFSIFLKGILQITLGAAFIVVAAEGIVSSASFFAEAFNIPIAMIGILGLGLGSALPEIYFSVAAAKKGKNWMILGQLTGSVIVLTTLVLGIVAIISPIEVEDFSPFAIARFFLIISALFFLIFLRTGRKITKKEGLILIGLYLTFVAFEIFSKLLCNPDLIFCLR